jgi:hypothetical protein
MPFVNETEAGPWEYQFGFYNTAWDEEGMSGPEVLCTLHDNGLRTEAQMDAIAQEIVDLITSSPVTMTSYGFSKVSRLTAEITPTP